MNTLTELQIQDLRPRLNVIPNRGSRRPRRGEVTSLTLHYNGPEVAGFGNPQRELKQVIEIDVPHQQRHLNADSLMYHLVVMSDGSIYQTRDYELIAWHCAHPDGNEHSLAIHLSLGGAQDATDVQWEATTLLFEKLIADYRLLSRLVVRGHREWSSTTCPGPQLMRRLNAWRASGVTLSRWRVRSDVPVANVRQGPGRNHPLVEYGQLQMFAGDILTADAIVLGEQIGAESRWAHRQDGRGFVHLSLLEPLA